MTEKNVPTTTCCNTAVASEAGTRVQERCVTPPVDIYEKENDLVVVADVPGADKDSLDIAVEEGVLTIQAAAKHTAPGERVYREFEPVNYYRQFQLSDKVDIDKISAALNNGVLTVTLPKAEAAKPKKVEVKIS